VKLHRRPQPNFSLLPLVPALSVGSLLIFFVLLGGTFLLQPGIAVEVPQSPFLLSPQRNPRVITVTAPPEPAIFYENRRVAPEALGAVLGESKEPSRTIIVKADRDAPAGLVVAVFTGATERGLHVVLATDPAP